jgi:DNA ligase (NAD+)
MNIEGLGDKIIEKLLSEGLIANAADIYRLKAGDLSSLPKFGEKSAEKLIVAIEKSKRVTLAKLLYALGIRYVGEETSELLAQKFAAAKLSDFLKNISLSTVTDLSAIDGVGAVVAAAVKDYFSRTENIKLLHELEALGITLRPLEVIATKSPISGKVFVLTGELDNFSRDEVKSMIKLAGGHVSSAVSAKTDYLVLGREPGSKYAEAKRLGIKILTEKELFDLIK